MPGIGFGNAVSRRAAALAFVCAAVLPAPGAEAAAVPDFSGYWVRPEAGNGRIFYPVTEDGPVPIVNTDTTAEFMIGDYTNPILLPHAAEAVKAHGDQGRAGIVEYPPWSLCWPTGVPLAVNMAEPVQVLQTPDKVTIIYQRGMQVRQIHLNVPHAGNSQPSWYGDAVGHYEGNDTLVVDIVAQDTRSVVDRFGTPKSPALRVVERYRIAPDRERLEITFTLEDPQTFTTPWSAKIAYVPVAQRGDNGRDRERIDEVVCAENNRDAAGGLFPIPVDMTPDF